MIPSCETHFATVVAQMWRDYITPRFKRSDDRAFKGKRAWELFVRDTLAIYLRRSAISLQLAKKPLDYEIHHLRAIVLRAMELPCTYCGLLFGVESFSVVERTPLVRGQRPAVALALANMQPCCASCAKAKTYMTDGEYARMVSTVRAINAEWLQRLVMRCLEDVPRLHANNRQGTSPAPHPASNARAAEKSQAQASKRGLSTTPGRGAAGLQAIARKRAKAKTAVAHG